MKVNTARLAWNWSPPSTHKKGEHRQHFIISHKFAVNCKNCELRELTVQANHFVLWTDPGLQSGISVRKLISTYGEQKIGAGLEWMVEQSQNPQKRKKKKKKATPPPRRW